jgi:hypothetical protein
MITSPPSARGRDPNRCMDPCRAWPDPPPALNPVCWSRALAFEGAHRQTLSSEPATGLVEDSDFACGPWRPVRRSIRMDPTSSSPLRCVPHGIDLEKKASSLQHRPRGNLGMAPHMGLENDCLSGIATLGMAPLGPLCPTAFPIIAQTISYSFHIPRLLVTSQVACPTSRVWHQSPSWIKPGASPQLNGDPPY